MIRSVCVVGMVCAGMAMAQAPAAPTAAASAKPMAFEVVSIRLNSTQQQRNGPPVFGPTADGYRMVGGPLLLPIITAYVPQTGAAAFMPNDIKGLPDWVMQGSYDIVAKVSDEDLAAWQNPASQKVMLPAMLQALLADRCKIVVHRDIKESPVYMLTVAKGGPKLKETDPSVDHPDGIKLPWGGVMVQSAEGINLYGTSMASLATLMGTMGGPNVGRQIQDKTGLTGRYDITVKRPPRPSGPQGPDQPGAASDPGGGMAAVVSALLDSLGLKLESGKQPVETLVIDHMERPSAN